MPHNTHSNTHFNLSMHLWTAVAPPCVLCVVCCDTLLWHSRQVYTPLAITMKIHVHTFSDRQMPKPQANNTLVTNLLPGTDQNHINTNTDTHTHTKHTQWELLLPPIMPPGVWSKCQPREKGLSTGAASEEALSTLHSSLEAYSHICTHTHMHIPLVTPTESSGWLTDGGGAERQTDRQRFCFHVFLFSHKSGNVFS